MSLSAVLILAAGKSKRMKTRKSKLMHHLLGKPIIFYPLQLAQALKPKKIIVVINPDSNELKTVLSAEKVEFAFQKQPLGTADAVRSALKNLQGLKGSVLILYGDNPLFTLKTLKRLIKVHQRARAVLSLLTAEFPYPCSFGRILRDSKGEIRAIVEARDANWEQRRIKEVNAGVYCVELDFLRKALGKIQPDNRQKEFYLTDLVELAVQSQLRVATYKTPDWSESLGINSRAELAQASAVLQEKINQGWMKRGVSIEAPSQVLIGPEVKIGMDTVIEAGARILGKSKIGRNCWIQAGVRILDSIIEDGVEVRQNSVIEESRIKKGAIIGPMARLRPGTVIGEKVRIGNFVELKKAVVGEGSTAAHLSYLGDAVIGKKVNIGAGTITCNYDGVKKHQTIIENGVFVGSDSQLVAPIRIGKGAYLGSGSTITEDVPEDALSLTRAQQVIKPGWAKKWRSRNFPRGKR